jgi:hypothetical protein
MTPIDKTQRPSYASLAQKNRELQARVTELESKKGPISIDPEKGALEVKDLRVGPLSVETAQIRAPALRNATRDLEKVETWLSGGKNSLQNFTDGLVVVDRLKARIPLPFVNSLMEKIAGDQMSRAGLSEVSLSQGEGDRLKIQGKVKKGIKVPFEVTGALGTTADGKVKFSLQTSKLGGLPMPNFLVSMATKFAGDSLSKGGVKVDDQKNYTFDPKGLQPDNILFRLDNLAVQDGAILVEGSAPFVEGKSSIPKISRKNR